MNIISVASVESQFPSPWSHYPSTDVTTVMPSYPCQSWYQEALPQYWSKSQVWEWLQQVLDMHQIDAASLPFHHFDLDGRQLCSMSFQDFSRAAGDVGPLLFHSLSELKWKGRFSGMELGSSADSALDVKTEANGTNYPCQMPFMEEAGFCPPADIFESAFPPQPPVASPTASSPGPRRTNSRSHQVRKNSPRGTHLWEFIRDILLSPERNSGLIKWENRAEGVFRFLKSEAVAQLWGKRKNNSSMTYEKLSRAMRYYYKREILERVDGRRLVYKFGRNAKGWQELEK